MAKITKKMVEDKLLEVMDPELNISIVDLGLVYYTKIIHDNKAVVTMTLTTIGCPLISIIEEEVKNKLMELGIKAKDIKIDLTFDPPWSMDKMSPRAKAMLGI